MLYIPALDLPAMDWPVQGIRQHHWHWMQKLLKRRNEELQRLLDAASVRPDPNEKQVFTPRLRIDLREQLILDNPASYSQTEDAELRGITEDSEAELRAQQSNLRAIMNGEL